MKVRSIILRTALAAVVAGGASLTAGAAFAQEVVPYAPYGHADHAHLMPVDLNIQIGMHGDRYWDGHRYWEHDEWMHHHPRDRDPWHHDDDHRLMPHRDDGMHRY
ncbi:hypothetical protein [Burkholderia guangdongensis]|uniref:hypothetical protein n=1 Tax=Burkholderia guangdongensis TaxID=1792500 RepID=UPI0015CA3444|nr:hypothetical protein [Burkholderia guangdongensis]